MTSDLFQTERILGQQSGFLTMLWLVGNEYFQPISYQNFKQVI